ncbi:unnamed protein product [Rotaria sordida]|uniref:Uncharacterized protein n=1 Tax=Rotaria sordida TaxID=392033 RepID=A0A818RD79_9BILA|nr:unnamed protein product [Rotaria sordida]CAF3647773.1 unnamed protein product [Rotaria sordida]
MKYIQIQGEIAIAYSLVQMLPSISLTFTEPSEIIILDIHALQNQFYFSSNIIVRLESTVELLFNELKAKETSTEIYTIAFSGDERHKCFSSYI